jgi:hypothetical protein
MGHEPVAIIATRQSDREVNDDSFSCVYFPLIYDAVYHKQILSDKIVD